MSSSRDLPDPGIEPTSPALAGTFSTTSTSWEAPYPFVFTLMLSRHLTQLRRIPKVSEDFRGAGFCKEFEIFRFFFFQFFKVVTDAADIRLGKE